MLLVRVHGHLQVRGGVLWPECREPVQWGEWVVVVLRVQWLCVVPWRWWVRW